LFVLPENSETVIKQCLAFLHRLLLIVSLRNDLLWYRQCS